MRPPARLVVATGTFALCILSSAPAAAQWVVFDPGMLIKNVAKHILDEKVLDHITEHQKAVYAAARRLVDVGVDVSRWIAQGMPVWTNWSVEPAIPQVAAFMDDLNQGRRSDFDGIGTVRRKAGQILAQVSPETAETLRSELATLDLIEETVLSASEGVGRIRAKSRSHRAMLAQAERDLVSTDGSTAAVLDAQSGVALLRGRQAEDTAQLLTPAMALLLAQAKRDRDADVVTLNMRAAAQERRAWNATRHGSADTFRNWSQP